MTSVAFGWDSFNHFPPLKETYHPVSTHNSLAQELFDQGLLAIYAFNYDQAVAFFDRASQFDPELAMAFWGMALALDESLDQFVTQNHATLTYELAQKALSLSQKATPQEKAYIEALQSRFSLNPKDDRNKLRAAYTKAMAHVVELYPDDRDAATLYAEAMMDELKWDFWTPEQKPREGTLKIITLLEGILHNDPYHVGANHYYIHTLENSPFPQRALMAAIHLDSLALSHWGHLLHTSSHIYMRVGAYEEAVAVNVRAIKADRSYVAKHGIEGQYPLKYSAHNLFYLTITYLWQERFDEALATALDVKKLVEPFFYDAPSMEFNLLLPIQVYLYFNKWDKILALPPPKALNGMERPFQTFAVAFAHAKQGELEKAKELRAQFLEQVDHYFAMRKIKADYPTQLFTLGDLLLQAAIAQLEGNMEQGLSSLKKAVAIQTQNFGVFTWTYPIAQTLGAYLIEMKQYDEAEKVFREILEIYPRNGRSLFGLFQSLKLQDKPTYMIERESKEALRFASHPLSNL